MDTIKKIEQDLLKPLKEKDQKRRNVLSMLKSDLENERIAKKRPLKDDEVLAVLARAVKSRQDSVAQYKEGGRDDLKQKEEEEIKIIQEYLPKQLSEEDVRAKAREIIKKTGAAGPKDMGKVMGQLMPQLQGRADGALVSKVVREELK